MAQLIMLYCAIFFAIETAKNSLRIQRVITRQYPGKTAENLQQLSWIMICVGFILAFTSSAMFLIVMLVVKVGAGMFVDWLHHRRMYLQEQAVSYNVNQLNYQRAKEITCSS